MKREKVTLRQRAAMRRALLISLCFANLSIGQSQKSLTVVTPDAARPSTLTANEIDRGQHYPSVIRLKGEVSIKTPFCVSGAKQLPPLCAGSIVIRADEATFHEDTGEIEASGKVAITPVRYEKATNPRN